MSTYTKTLAKLLESMGVSTQWIPIFLTIAFFLSFFLLCPSFAYAYPISENEEVDVDLPPVVSLGDFLKKKGYAKESVCDYRLADICQAASELCVDDDREFYVLVLSVISKESMFDETTVGSAGDTGLMQVVPKWHKARMERLGVDDLSDPIGGLTVGIDYLRELVNGYDCFGDALIHYNGGPSAVTADHPIKSVSEYARDVLIRYYDIEYFLETGNG